jgi:Flp pilus assembly protein TadD
MTDRTNVGPPLAGQCVAFTGRLASMSRRVAVETVERNGGSVTPTVNQQTTLLVIGREGWPLKPDGHLTRKLQRARRLQQKKYAIEVVPEERFLRLTELQPLEDQVRRTYTTAELTDLLDVPRSQIEAWQRSGYIVPAEYRDGMPCFDFRQVTAGRALRGLVAAGVPPRRLLRSIRQLRSWLSDDAPAGDLVTGLIHFGNRFLVRTDRGGLAETTGQLVFEFPSDESDRRFPPNSGDLRSMAVARSGDRPQLPSSLPWSKGACADGLFDDAVRLEEEGRLEDAAQRYRELLRDEGPDADVCFNLANVLQLLGETQAAIERLHEAVAIDPEHADAWNNLGNLLADRNRLDEALDAYRRAVAVEPDYADALYGLADVLEQLGRLEEARVHWRTYLQNEPAGECADYARSRLATQTG